ncbi:hypothetical protein G7046_g5484 [Stylonectria norvegica]|nr:hypothetical protein G7046_g5484 [Stylonectria norvegica]
MDNSITYHISGNFLITMHVASRDQTVRFIVDLRKLEAVCPAWHTILIDEGVPNKGILVPWTDEEAEFALFIILHLAAGAQHQRKQLRTATARELFYIAEMYEWMGRPRHPTRSRGQLKLGLSRLDTESSFLPADVVRDGIENLIREAAELCRVENWVLLGIVATTFRLRSIEAAVKRALVLFSTPDSFGVLLGDNGRATGSFNLTESHLKVLQKLGYFNPRVELCRIRCIEQILKGIKLLVSQLEYFDQGLLPNDKLYDKYGIATCPRCEPLSMVGLLRELMAVGLWPVPRATAYRGSIDGLLGIIRDVVCNMENYYRREGRASSGSACNSFIHMCNHLTSIARSFLDDGDVWDGDDFGNRLKAIKGEAAAKE